MNLQRRTWWRSSQNGDNSPSGDIEPRSAAEGAKMGASEPPLHSLFSGSNSLFSRINSLFGPKKFPVPMRR
jgi:hypothetical protein